MTLQTDLSAAVRHAQQGQHKAALKAAKAGMRRHKTHPAFPNIAAIALCAMGREGEAVPLFQKALALKPEFHDARKNLGQALISLGKPDRAAKVLDKLVAQTPKEASAWYLLAVARSEAGAFEQADAAVSTAIGLAPKNPAGFDLRARIRERSGQGVAAIADRETLLALVPGAIENRILLSRLLAAQMRPVEALQLIRDAIDQAPDHLDLRRQLATLLLAEGDMTGATEAFQQILTRSPGDVDAIAQLALLQDDDQIAALMPIAEAALARVPPKSDDHANLLFALSQVAGKCGDSARQDACLIEANREMAALHPYDAGAQEALNRAIMARFPKPVVLAPPEKPARPRPIYVVGMPRSGTTLTEAVLGAHPQVQPLGERAPTDAVIFPRLQQDLAIGPDELAAFRAADIDTLPAMPEDTLAYVDKLPENHRFLGFLKSAYPESHLIHVRRDPRDVALSMWRGNFGGRQLSYTYDLRTMAHRFNLYAEIMAHWHRVLPGQILEIDYDDLVSRIEDTGQAMARFCDLDWHPAMAQPDRHAGTVRTLSAYQLRQPVHSRSIGKWRQHADLLQPFVEALDPDLWPGLR